MNRRARRFTQSDPIRTTAMERMATTVTELTGRTAPMRTGPTETLTEPTERIATGPTAPTPTETTAEPELQRLGLSALVGTDAAGFRNTLGRCSYQTRMAPRAAAQLFGWPQLNAALAEHRLTPPRLRLEQAGRDVTPGLFRSRRTRRGPVLQDLDAAVLTERLREGATLIVDAVNEISPALQALCSSLSAEFTATCQANLYACWGVTQGFDVHWDDHDVFVVQVEGRKQWALYGLTQAAPTRRGRGAEAPPPQTEPELVVLEPGDVLYLPRGFWHAAVGLGGPTLHLTIGLTRKTGADLLHWLADELQVEPGFRSDLPFEAGDAATGAALGGLLARLQREDPAALARRYRRHVEAALPQRPQLAFPHIGGDEPLSSDMRFVLGQGPARLETRQAGPVLSWRGVEFTISSRLESAMRRLLAGEPVSIADLRAAAPAASDDQLQRFVGELMRRGALVPQGAGGR